MVRNLGQLSEIEFLALASVKIISHMKGDFISFDDAMHIYYNLLDTFSKSIHKDINTFDDVVSKDNIIKWYIDSVLKVSLEKLGALLDKQEPLNLNESGNMKVIFRDATRDIMLIVALAVSDYNKGITDIDKTGWLDHEIELSGDNLAFMSKEIEHFSKMQDYKTALTTLILAYTEKIEDLLYKLNELFRASLFTDILTKNKTIEQMSKIETLMYSYPCYADSVGVDSSLENNFDFTDYMKKAADIWDNE